MFLLIFGPFLMVGTENIPKWSISPSEIYQNDLIYLTYLHIVLWKLIFHALYAHRPIFPKGPTYFKKDRGPKITISRDKPTTKSACIFTTIEYFSLKLTCSID